MVAPHVLQLSLALVAVIHLAVGDNSGAIQTDTSADISSLHPHSNRNLHTLSSRTLLQTNEDGERFGPSESLANYLSSNKGYGAGPLTSQEEAVDDESMADSPYAMEMNAWNKRSGLMSQSGRMGRGNSKERLFRMLQHRPLLGGGGLGLSNTGSNANNAWTSNDLKRERSSGATLSVESSLDLIRHKFIQELRRRQMMEKQKQIESNGDLLSSIGKRSGLQSTIINH